MGNLSFGDTAKKINNSNNKVVINVDDTSDTTAVATTTTRKRRKKSETTELTAPQAQTSMSYIQSNIPYMNAYNETNIQLDSAIKQLDALGGGLMYELEAIRNKNTLKNKYNYMNDMTQTITSIISSKISAIKEKNKTINDVNNLEIRRIKDLKLSAKEEDDNTKMMNLYNAFINTPINNGQNRMDLLGPSIQSITTNGGAGLPVSSLGGDSSVDWDPSMNRMLLDAKGAIETIVVYDQSTGNRWFEVIDKNTGEPLDNVERPDDTYIYDLNINISNGYAKDTNLNKMYKLKVVGNIGNLSEY